MSIKALFDRLDSMTYSQLMESPSIAIYKRIAFHLAYLPNDDVWAQIASYGYERTAMHVKLVITANLSFHEIDELAKKLSTVLHTILSVYYNELGLSVEHVMASPAFSDFEIALH